MIPAESVTSRYLGCRLVVYEDIIEVYDGRRLLTKCQTFSSMRRFVRGYRRG